MLAARRWIVGIFAVLIGLGAAWRSLPEKPLLAPFWVGLAAAGVYSMARPSRLSNPILEVAWGAAVTASMLVQGFGEHSTSSAYSAGQWLGRALGILLLLHGAYGLVRARTKHPPPPGASPS